MTDNVYIFDLNTGRGLCELDCVVVRQWKLERSQRPGRAVVRLKASDYDGNLLNYRNFVVVVSDVVPTWVGYFSVSPADRRWADGSVFITVFSAEYLLALRRLPYSGVLPGETTTIFPQIVAFGEKKDSMFITSSDTTGGTKRAYTLEYKRQTCFDALNDLVNYTQNYWWLEPIGTNNQMITQSSRLKLVARLSRSRGVEFSDPLVQGTNLVNVEASEIGQMANVIYVQGYNASNDDPIEVEVRDEESIGKYGIIEDIFSVRNATSLENLRDIGNQQLLRRANPRYLVTGDVISTPYPRIGDKVNLEIENAFFGLKNRQNIVGANLKVIIKSVAYSPESASVNIVADNVFWN